MRVETGYVRVLYLRLDALGERPPLHLGLVVHVGDLIDDDRGNIYKAHVPRFIKLS